VFDTKPSRRILRMEVSTKREPGTTNDGERTGKAVTVVAEADRIPAVHSDAVNSPIVAKVEAKPNEINLDLKRIPLR